MGLFGKKKREYPVMPAGEYEPVLRCSICTGEQVLCIKDLKTGSMHDLMLIRNTAELEGFCRENGLDIDKIQKVY